MTFTKITTAGAGTMGSQVAWQMAFHGKQVIVYDAIPGMIALRTGMGPCGMMDRMGLGAVCHVARLLGESDPNTRALECARYVDEQFIRKGRLGAATGQGFYSYPNPAFAQPGFIRSVTRGALNEPHALNRSNG